MTQSLRISGIDLNRAYTAANSGTSYAAPTCTLQTGTADSQFPVANITTWNLANKFRAACVAGAMTARIDATSSMVGSYNAVIVVEPYITTYNPVLDTATLFTSLALYSGSTSGTITTLEDTITAANLNDGDVLKVGLSRCWVLKISSASTLSTSSAGKFLELRWTGSGTTTFGCSKIAVVNMQQFFSDFDVPVMDSIQYNFIDRDFLNQTEGGGQSRYSRPYIRSVKLPASMAGKIGLPLSSFSASVVTDAEPYIISMDWGSDTVAGGEHIHTFPVRLNSGVQMSQRSQFSKSAFMMADYTLDYREYR